MKSKLFFLCMLSLSLSSCHEMAEGFKKGYYASKNRRQKIVKNTTMSSGTRNNRFNSIASQTNSVESQMISEAQEFLRTGYIQPWNTPQQAVHQYRVFWIAFYQATYYGLSTGDNNGVFNLLQNLEKVVSSWYMRFAYTRMVNEYLTEERRTSNSIEAQLAVKASEGYKSLRLNNIFTDFWTSPGYEFSAQNVLNHLLYFRQWIQGQSTAIDPKRMEHIHKYYERSLMNSIPNYVG